MDSDGNQQSPLALLFLQPTDLPQFKGKKLRIHRNLWDTRIKVAKASFKQLFSSMKRGITLLSRFSSSKVRSIVLLLPSTHSISYGIFRN